MKPFSASELIGDFDVKYVSPEVTYTGFVNFFVTGNCVSTYLKKDDNTEQNCDFSSSKIL